MRTAIFGAVHCLRCVSKSPPLWITNNKAKKNNEALPVTTEAFEFLDRQLLGSVG